MPIFVFWKSLSNLGKLLLKSNLLQRTRILTKNCIWIAKTTFEIVFSIQNTVLIKILSILGIYILQDRSYQRSTQPAHSPGNDCRLILKFWDGRMYGLTDTLCENSDHYRAGLWSASWIKKYYPSMLSWAWKRIKFVWMCYRHA